MSIIGAISNVEKNNLIPVAGAGDGLTLEPLLRTFTRYDFTFQLESTDGTFPQTGSYIAGLLPNRVGVASPYGVVASACALSVHWTQDVAGPGGTYSGLKGTVIETWKSFGVQIAQRLNVDPGFTGRRGQRYTLLLAGTEYRGYVDYKPSGGNTPLAIVAGPTGGFDYPIRLGVGVFGGVSQELQIQDIVLGGDLGSKTIYASRDKQEDSQIVFTADASTDVLTSTAHGYVDGASLTVRNSGGGLPAPLIAGTKYYVRDRTANTFKLAATSGGAAIDITSNGTGTQYAMLTMHFRIYQKPKIAGFPNGIPFDIDV